MGSSAIKQEIAIVERKRSEFKDTKIGRVPEDWEVKTIRELSKTEAGGTPSTKVKDYWNGDVPWLNSGALQDCIVSSPSKYITKKGLDNSAAKLLPSGSVLIALTGATTGKVGYLTFESSANQSVVAILPNKERFEPIFLYYYLINNRQYVLSKNIGSAQPHINKEIVDNLVVTLPPLPEQRAIAEILSNIDKKLELEKQRKARFERIKRGLMNDLLTGRKRVVLT